MDKDLQTTTLDQHKFLINTFVSFCEDDLLPFFQRSLNIIWGTKLANRQTSPTVGIPHYICYFRFFHNCKAVLYKFLWASFPQIITRIIVSIIHVCNKASLFSLKEKVRKNMNGSSGTFQGRHGWNRSVCSVQYIYCLVTQTNILYVQCVRMNIHRAIYLTLLMYNSSCTFTASWP